MAKISNLPVIGPITDEDLLVVVQGDQTRRASLAQLVAGAGAIAADASYDLNDVSLPTDRDLIDPSRLQLGVLVNSSGGVDRIAGFSMSSLLPVGQGPFVCDVTIAVSAPYGVQWLDAGMNQVDFQTGPIAAGVPISTSVETALYARFGQQDPLFVDMHAYRGSALPTSARAFGALDLLSGRELARALAIDADGELRNWLDPSRFVADTVLLNDGTTEYNTAFTTTGRIQVSPGDSVILNKWPGTIEAASLVWFGAKGRVVGSPAVRLAGDTPYLAPARAAFFEFCVANYRLPGLAVNVAKGLTRAAPYRHPGGLTIADEKRLRDLFYGLLGARRGENIFDPTRVKGGAQRIDGTIDEGNADFRTSIPIAVMPGGKISLWHLGGPFGVPDFGHVFMDLGENPVGAIPFPAVPGVYDVPANAFSIQVTMPKSHLGNFVLTPDNSNPQGYIPPTAQLRQLVRPWFNLSLGIIGDSITNAGYWVQPLLKRLGARLGFKSGIDGRQLKDAFSQNPDLTQIDGLIVFLGTNDWYYGRPLGTDADTSAAQTFAGDIRRFFETVAAVRKDLRIIWLTSLQRMGGDTTGAGVAEGTRGRNSLGHALEDYVDIGMKIVGQYGHPVVDLYRQSGANEFTLLTGTANNNDRVHPTEVTAPLWISAPVAGAMSQIVPLLL